MSCSGKSSIAECNRSRAKKPESGPTSATRSYAWYPVRRLTLDPEETSPGNSGSGPAADRHQILKRYADAEPGAKLVDTRHERGPQLVSPRLIESLRNRAH